MARTEEEQKGISLLGNQHVAYPSDYSADILESLSDYWTAGFCDNLHLLCAGCAHGGE